MPGREACGRRARRGERAPGQRNPCACERHTACPPPTTSEARVAQGAQHAGAVQLHVRRRRQHPGAAASVEVGGCMRSLAAIYCALSVHRRNPPPLDCASTPRARLPPAGRAAERAGRQQGRQPGAQGRQGPRADKRAVCRAGEPPSWASRRHPACAQEETGRRRHCRRVTLGLVVLLPDMRTRGAARTAGTGGL